jgi:peroxiredoxin
MMERFRSGLDTGTPAPDFKVYDHANKAHRLANLMGENGLLMGFASDIWDLGCVRHVLWLQRQTYKLSLAGINSAILMPNQPYELTGFYMSIPRKIGFPLLADPDGTAFEAYEIEYPGFMFINGDGIVERKWFLRGDATPRLQDILQTAGV